MDDWQTGNPKEKGRYLIFDNGMDFALWTGKEWKSEDRPIKSTSPYLKSRFRATLHPTHYKVFNQTQ